MNISDFDFYLPENLIAQNPVSPRDHSRLMVLDRADQSIKHDYFYNLPKYLCDDDVMVFNRSKVIPARLKLHFDADGGSGADGVGGDERFATRSAEVFLCRDLGDAKWLAMVKPGRKFKPGVRVRIEDDVFISVLDVKEDGMRIVQFVTGVDAPLSGVIVRELINKLGSTPLPPYIKNSSSSAGDYQTIYAKDDGSVAAPTAGLHFTEELFEKLSVKGIAREFVTLHVGPGTFLPVKSSSVEGHTMHEEEYFVDFGTSERLTEAVRCGKRLIAVGTTSVRVLESVATLDGVFKEGKGVTDIFIYPGYHWKCVGGMITNFHLPKSTLLLLVSSFAGKDFVMKAYEEAIREKYRFYSFGDGMLIL